MLVCDYVDYIKEKRVIVEIEDYFWNFIVSVYKNFFFGLVKISI